MPIAAGSSLGPYEIVSLIGAGGMGEVYRARDKRLDRVVAVKVLPSALSENPALRQRLEREARAVSSLAHPHICTLFDVGETPDGSIFLVMEHLEGESLADRLTRGPLPVRQALKLGAEIAEALHAAHRGGIVHRDLKPANVMLTKSGVKLLDFGLAKLVTPDGGIVSDPNSPTVQQKNDLTAEGHIVGTLQYMAPEQLEGKPADSRTDIFALGATLHEMLTGQRAFSAASRAALIANILHEDPPPLANVPPNVARLVAHCLMKEPDERWQTARDVAIQLRGAAEGSSVDTLATPPRSRRDTLRRAAMALLLVAAGLAAGLLWNRLGPVEDSGVKRLTHLSIDLSPDDDSLALQNEGVVAVSPDGSKIVVLARSGKTARLYLRGTDSFTIAPIAGTDNSTTAFFSPDGKELAFVAGSKLKRLVLGSDTAEVLADVGPVQGGSWGTDGNIVYNQIPGSPLQRISAAGGAATPVRAKGVQGNLILPEYLPERNLLFCVREVDGKSYEEAEIVAVALDTAEARVVTRGTWPRFVSSRNELLFARGGRIWSVGFDSKRLAVRGTPEVVVEGLLVYPGNGGAAFDATEAGDIIYAPFSSERLKRRLMLVGRDGRAEPLPFPPAEYDAPSLSADGHLLAVEVIGANNDVWLGDLRRGTLNRLTSTMENLAPLLSPDGQQVIVSRHGGSMPAMTLLRTDGAGEPRPVTPAATARFAHSWSDDGTTVAFTHFTATSSDVYVLHLGDGSVTPVATSRFNESGGALSPDGRWIAYVSDETGRPEVYVRPVASGGTRVRISTAGGSDPLWAHGGNELFYWQGDDIQSVALTLTSSISAAAPVRLFSFPAHARDIGRNWDITPDDRKFVMIERSAAAASMRTLHVVRR